MSISEKEPESKQAKPNQRLACQCKIMKGEVEIENP